MESLRLAAKKGITVFSVKLFFVLALAGMASAQPGRNSFDDDYPHSPTLSPSLLAVVSVLIIVMFIIGFIAICVSRRVYTAAPDTTTRPPPRRAVARGVDATTLESFPTFAYSDVKNLKIGKGALECAVCLSEFEDDDTLRLIPKCDHVFHKQCIGEWLHSHVTCPVCRADLTEPSPTEKDDVEAQAATVPADMTVQQDRSGRQEGGDVGERAEDDQPRCDFRRSHTTGHSLVQNNERFTLRLPEEVRKQIMAAAGEGSSRRGRLRVRSDRWLRKTQSFLLRLPSFKSPRVATDSGEGTSAPPVQTESVTKDPVRLPV